MLPLPDQVRLVTQYADIIAARLSSREPTTFDNSQLNSFNAFHERINTVLSTLENVDREMANGEADLVRPTYLGRETGPVDMSAGAFVHSVALPNVYFHLVTAYGILRKEGVEVGKRDYYEGFFPLGRAEEGKKEQDGQKGSQENV